MKALQIVKAAFSLTGIAVAFMVVTNQGRAALATVSSTASMPTQSTDIRFNFIFPKFDVTLGTLKEVDISLSTSGATVFTMQNLGNLPGSFTAFSDIAFSLSDPNNYLGDDFALDLVFSKISFTVPKGATYSSGWVTADASFSQDFNSANTLAEFSANYASNILLGLSSETTTMEGFSGSGSVQQDSVAGATLTVAYQYDSAGAGVPNVPEPGIFWALALLIGLSSGSNLLVRGIKRNRKLFG